jgi:23S rRNA pseudouridine1911/1915/1917 synthase
MKNQLDALAGLQVIFEDNHLIAVNKPAGISVQEDESGGTSLDELVKQYIKVRYNKPGEVFLGVIHRIDKPVTGVTLFARTSKALERMNKLFADRKVQKTYWALVTERPEPLNGHLEHYLLKDKQQHKTRVFEKPSKRNEGSKLSTLDYELMGSLEGLHLLKVTPHTGRPHQIRAQLSYMGWPIVGDMKYGYPQANPDLSIQLHCRAMSFEHPVGGAQVSLQADPPLAGNWKKFRGFFE